MIYTVENRITKVKVSQRWTAAERKALSKKIRLAQKLTKKELDRDSKYATYDSPFKNQCATEIKFYKLLLSLLKIDQPSNLEKNRKSFSEFIL